MTTPKVMSESMPFPGLNIVQHLIWKRSAPIEATVDPLLAEIFATQEISVTTSATTMSTTTTTTTATTTTTTMMSTTATSATSTTSSTLAPLKSPKPKPIFTDARKLDNSRDWENVKIAKPPQEELVEPTTRPTTTTPTSTSHGGGDDPILDLLSDNPVVDTVRREVKEEEKDAILELLQSSSKTTPIAGGTSPEKKTPNIDQDPVLVLLSDAENPKDKVAYEIHKEVEGLERDIKESDRLLEWLSAPDTAQPPTVSRSKRSAKSHHEIHNPLLSEARDE